MEQILVFDEALQVVLRQAGLTGQRIREMQQLPLLECLGRVLAEPIAADRDQPPFDRSTRDGYAVRIEAASGGKSLKLLGQVRAGETWQGRPLELGEAIEIMTGAPLPQGADAVAMVEHVELENGSLRLSAGRTLVAGENVVARGS